MVANISKSISDKLIVSKSAEMPEQQIHQVSRLVVTNLEPGIFQLQISDLDSENRLSEELSDELMATLSQLSVDPDLKVLVITGTKKVFCAGASLEVLKQIYLGNTDVKDLRLPNQMLDFPVPVIAALEGHAVGGGLVLALCSDIVIAAENSRYGVNFINLGFTPGMGTMALLPAVAGHSFASEMILTGKLYKGKELKDRGLFNYVLPAEQVLDAALDIARRIAEKPRYILEMVKDTLTLSRRQALHAALSREHLMHRICFSHPETIAQINNSYMSQKD